MKLISISDFTAYRAISSNINDLKRIDPFITEAQEFDLRPVMGDRLYYDFLANITDSKYVDLLSGKTYTYDTYTYVYDGVKPILVYFAYARFILNQQVNVTNFGIVHKTTQYSEPVTEKTLARLSGQARDSAKAYEQKMIDFLDRYSDTYTLWGVGGTKIGGGVNIIKI